MKIIEWGGTTPFKAIPDVCWRTSALLRWRGSCCRSFLEVAWSRRWARSLSPSGGWNLFRLSTGLSWTWSWACCICDRPPVPILWCRCPRRQLSLVPYFVAPRRQLWLSHDDITHRELEACGEGIWCWGILTHSSRKFNWRDYPLPGPRVMSLIVPGPPSPSKRSVFTKNWGSRLGKIKSMFDAILMHRSGAQSFAVHSNSSFPISDYCQNQEIHFMIAYVTFTDAQITEWSTLAGWLKKESNWLFPKQMPLVDNHHLRFLKYWQSCKEWRTKL